MKIDNIAYVSKQ